ncbi:conserved exported hypothetical protein [Candidatus Terasakiella magnetica]|nr:conserved exported hypothetical protein [Candidatus Terasakiella magnetica]
MIIRRASLIALAALATGSLAGCGALLDPHGFGDTARSVLIPNLTDSSNKAMSALTAGNFANAERYALASLRQNPKDPYALYVAGMVYQATGRYDLARQYYEVILANHPTLSVTVTGPNGPQSFPLVDVAQSNLQMVDKLLGRQSPRSAAQSGRLPDPVPPLFEPMAPAAVGRGMVAAQPLGEPARASGNQAETNVSGRFRILKRLLDEGLITPDEYARRRNTNLGALMPYAAGAPPAQGLERSIPTDEQVVERLRELGKALETRAISPSEHAGERAAILDALLQAEPRRLDLPVLPPNDVMEAANAVGRVERMRSAGLVSGEEAKRERDAIERMLDSQLAKQPISGTATGLRQGAPPPVNTAVTKAASGPGNSLGALLGSAKSEDAARKTWDGIKAKFPEELGAMSAAFPKVEMGEKGVRWRVVAGPFSSAADTRKMCKMLKLHRQSCEPTGF